MAQKPVVILDTVGSTVDVPQGTDTYLLAEDVEIVGDLTVTGAVQLGGAVDGQGYDLNNLGVVFLTEQAAAEADVAGKGQHWVKTATPNRPMFTDDAGADFEMLFLPIMGAASDETTALTTGTAKLTYRMPCAMTLLAVRASVTTAPTGSTLTVDINETGTGSILSTVISIDASEKTSTTAATPAVISDAALADDAEITIDIDQVGSTIAGAGLKVTLIGYRA